MKLVFFASSRIISIAIGRYIWLDGLEYYFDASYRTRNEALYFCHKNNMQMPSPPFGGIAEGKIKDLHSFYTTTTDVSNKPSFALLILRYSDLSIDFALYVVIG